MASPSYTYTLTNGTTADASQVMQNFNDILNGVTDATKDLSISALTVAGTCTLNGAINLGNASSDDITITGSLASTFPIKTDVTYNFGSASLRLEKMFCHRYQGTKTNDAAAAGEIGELVTSTISSAQNAAASNNLLALTSIAVPGAGDYELTVSATQLGAGAVFTGTCSMYVSGVSAAGAATSGLLDLGFDYPNFTTGQSTGTSSKVRVLSDGTNITFNGLNSVASQTIFLNVQSTYSAGTPTWRGTITLERRR